VPTLRFSSFRETWQQCRLGPLTNKIGSGVTPRGGVAVYTDSGVLFIRSQNVKDDRLVVDDVVYISHAIHNTMVGSEVKPGDILLNITGASIGRSCVVPSDISLSNVNQHVCIIRLKNICEPKFLQMILSSWRGQKLIYQQQAGGGREGLNFENIGSFKINIPSLPEQQKIAAFLSAVDKKIQLLQKKKELLGQYKKGVMQKIFSREIRFKDENGQDYPEWEWVGGDQLFDNISDKNHNSDLPILAITQDQGAIPRDQIDYKMTVTEKSIASYKVVQVGDFVISLRTFQGGIEYSKYKGICSPAYIILRPSSDAVDRDFYRFYLKTIYYINLLQRTLEGIRDGKMISYKYFSEIKLPFPSLPEQQKVAGFLSIFDHKIELITNQITQARQFKKGLLQQMFV